MAQSAVGAIRAGCQMLSEGKAEIGKFKKQVEGGVADAKAIYKEVTACFLERSCAIALPTIPAPSTAILILVSQVLHPQLHIIYFITSL